LFAGTKIKKRTLVLFLISILLAVFFIQFSRPIVITSDGEKNFFLFWSWNKGKIEFINSVTGGKVDIYFSMTHDFNDFYMKTNEETENYYTDGTYNINERLKKERRKALSFSSVKGIKLTLADKVFNIKNDLLKVELLWSTELF
jgi:energy-coupling factor transporter transmembrane protein EcfT